MTYGKGFNAAPPVRPVRRLHRRARFAIALAALVAAAGPVSAQEEPPLDTVIATVGGTEITLGHMILMRRNLPEKYADAPIDTLYEGLLDRLIRQTALAQRLEGELPSRARLQLDNTRRALAAEAVVDDIADVSVTEEALRAAYEKRFAGDGSTREYKAAHILVDTKEEAEEIIAALDDGTPFAELARERSTGPSSARGGELGWFGKNAMVAPFAEAVADMEPGTVSAPVETQFGWHVIRLEATREADMPEFEAVRGELTQDLKLKATRDRIADIVAETRVERGDDGIDPSVLNTSRLGVQ